MNHEELIKIEKIEHHYLNKYYHFLKFAEEEILIGLKTREAIHKHWYGFYESGISDYDKGAERIIYSLLNGKGIGQPNSAPVGSDLFFETEQAFVHLDLKTVGATLNPRPSNHKDGSWSNNIGDYCESIFVGTNQNSYKGEIKKSNGKSFNPKRIYEPHLPKMYEITPIPKPSVSYFITILHDKDSLDMLVMSIVCMPNGSLESYYKSKPLSAGKTNSEARFHFVKTPDFELLDNKPKRVKVVFFDKKMDSSYRDKLVFFENLFDKQN